MLHQGIHDIEKKINACIENFSRWFVAKNHRRCTAEKLKTVYIIRRQFGEIHEGKNVADTSATLRRCSQHACVNIAMFIRCDNIPDGLGDTSRMLWRFFRLRVLFSHCNAPTEQDLIQQPQGIWFHVKSLHLLYALHIYFTIGMTSSRHSSRHHHDIAKDITITTLTHPRYSSVARRRITDHRRFSKYIVNC